MLNPGKKSKRQSAAPKRKLTRKEQKLINELKQKHSKKNKRGISAQETIPYQRMYPDGIAYIGNKKYSKTIRFDDITYQLAKPEDKNTIFAKWCDLINYFDPTISFQLSFFNRRTSKSEFSGVYCIELRNDTDDAIRTEYSDYITSQMARGDNGLNKSKYLTFTVEEANYDLAKMRLERIEIDIVNNFKQIGVQTEVLNGKARLELIFKMLHIGDRNNHFMFEWSWLAQSGLNTKDFIAPSSFEFKTGRYFRIGQTYAATSFVQILAPEISDRMLTDMLNMTSSQIVSLHIKRFEQSKAIKTVKRQLTNIEQMKIEEQKKAVRAGYDMDIMPADISTYGEEAHNLLYELQQHNEGMFYVTMIVCTFASSKERLNINIGQLSSLVQQKNCALTRLDFQQEQGLIASLPLGLNPLEITRTLTTSSTAVFIPFTSQELRVNSPESLYYGLNALSNNVILADRKKQKNPNGLILGTPGSGKSFAAKREMMNVFFITMDDIRICDPEGEYYPVVSAIGGQIIKISPKSNQYINPLDFHENYADDDENPIRLKVDFVLSLCEIIAGGRDGLMPIEKTVIDRAVRNIYAPYLADPDPSRMPILEDLYNELRTMGNNGGEEAKQLADAMELYVHGSLNIFNHRTNVDVMNRVVCYDIKELGSQLKALGMLIVQDQIWNAVSKNRDKSRSTWYYADEFHLLLRDPETARHSVDMWKRFRKWGGVPTGITQNVKDLLASREISVILENSDFLLLLNQNGEDRLILAQHRGISPEQLSYVQNSGEGEGLLLYGSAIIPFIDKFPRDTQMYKLMTTKPTEIEGVGNG